LYVLPGALAAMPPPPWQHLVNGPRPRSTHPTAGVGVYSRNHGPPWQMLTPVARSRGPASTASPSYAKCPQVFHGHQLLLGLPTSSDAYGTRDEAGSFAGVPRADAPQMSPARPCPRGGPTIRPVPVAVTSRSERASRFVHRRENPPSNGWPGASTFKTLGK